MCFLIPYLSPLAKIPVICNMNYFFFLSWFLLLNHVTSLNFLDWQRLRLGPYEICKQQLIIGMGRIDLTSNIYVQEHYYQRKKLRKSHSNVLGSWDPNGSARAILTLFLAGKGDAFFLKPLHPQENMKRYSRLYHQTCFACMNISPFICPFYCW